MPTQERMRDGTDQRKVGYIIYIGLVLVNGKKEMTILSQQNFEPLILPSKSKGSAGFYIELQPKYNVVP